MAYLLPKVNLALHAYAIFNTSFETEERELHENLNCVTSQLNYEEIASYGRG